MEPFNLQNMELNDVRDIDRDIMVRRVPGGWIFEYWGDAFDPDGQQLGKNILTTCFVPFNDEFKTIKLNYGA